MTERAAEVLAAHELIGKTAPAHPDHDCRFVRRVGECVCERIVIGCTGCGWTAEPDGAQRNAHRAHVASILAEKFERASNDLRAEGARDVFEAMERAHARTLGQTWDRAVSAIRAAAREAVARIEGRE